MIDHAVGDTHTLRVHRWCFQPYYAIFSMRICASFLWSGPEDFPQRHRDNRLTSQIHPPLQRISSTERLHAAAIICFIVERRMRNLLL